MTDKLGVSVLVGGLHWAHNPDLLEKILQRCTQFVTF